MSVAVLGLVLALQLPGWRPAGVLGEESALERVLYLETGDVKRLSPSSVEMRIAQVFATRQKAGTSEFDWIETTYTVDCAGRTALATKTLFKQQKGLDSSAPGNGTPIAYSNNLPMARAAKAACSGDYSTFLQHTPGLYYSTQWIFTHLHLMQASTKSTNWWRTGTGGAPGSRIAMFVDRSTIRQGIAPSIRHAVIMTVAETPGRPVSRFRTGVALSCDTGKRSEVVSEVLIGTRSVSTFPVSEYGPSAPGTLMATLRAPICASDFSRGRAYPMQHHAVEATAFAP